MKKIDIAKITIKNNILSTSKQVKKFKALIEDDGEFEKFIQELDELWISFKNDLLDDTNSNKNK